MEKESKMIKSAVKKVVLPLQSLHSFKVLGQDKGNIDEEEYEIAITQAGPLINYKTLEVNFM